jgi:hypothetical protein
MQTPNEPEELITGGSLKLSSATEKLVATGSLNLSSPLDAESERKNRDQDKELERDQKRANFWVKDIGVFLLALLLILLIDLYAFTILLQDNASEGKIRFAMPAATA